MRFLAASLCALVACAGKVETAPSDGCEVLLSVDARTVGAEQELRVKAKNVSRRDLTLSLKDQCPAGALAIAGLPTNYDVYGTCNAGPCLTSPRELVHRLSAGATVEVAVARIGSNSVCQPPLPPGSYSVSPVAPDNVLRLCTTESTFTIAQPPPAHVVVTPTPPPPQKRPAYSRPPVPKEYACETSADCTLVCPENKACCGNPCGCSHAMNREFAEGFVRDYPKRCAKPPNCPAMGCAYQPAFGASCHEGRCVAGSGAGGF